MGDVVQDVELHPGEEFPLPGNFEDVLADGETVVSAASAVYKSDGTAGPAGLLSGTPQVASPRAQQKVTMGTGVALGEDYLVVLTATTSLALDWVQRFRVKCRPLTVLAPALETEGADANSYATKAEAEAYLATRLRAWAWEAASVRDRALALIQAAREIDAVPWKGEKADVDWDAATPTRWAQALAWPRTTQIDADGNYMIPPEVREAACEQALFLLETSGAERRQRLQAGGIGSFSVEGMSESYRAGAGAGSLRPWDRLCPRAQALLARHADWAVEVRRA